MKSPHGRCGKRLSRKNSRGKRSLSTNNRIIQPGIRMCGTKPPGPAGLNRSPGNRSGRSDNLTEHFGISQSQTKSLRLIRRSMSTSNRLGRRSNPLPSRSRNGRELLWKHRLCMRAGGKSNRAATSQPAAMTPYTRITLPTRRAALRIPIGMPTQT